MFVFVTKAVGRVANELCVSSKSLDGSGFVRGRVVRRMVKEFVGM